MGAGVGIPVLMVCICFYLQNVTEDQKNLRKYLKKRKGLLKSHEIPRVPFPPGIQRPSDVVNEGTGCETSHRPLNNEPSQTEAESPACASTGHKN